MKALLFDFDGTLLNTNELIIRTFMHVLNERFPGQYSPKDCIKFIGPSLKETFEQIAPNEADELIAKYRQFNHAYHDLYVKEFDGVNETLEQLKREGHKLAIVSTKKKETIERGLKYMKAEHYFDFWIGLEDVKKVKPDPEPVLLALDRLKVPKEKTLMIGDNYHDILAGKNAGVKTAGVAWSIKGEHYLKQFNPDFMLHHMSDLLTIVKGL
ncbi:pyrophosphatase PpaX [Ureibacillus sp. FSL K6-8385]|uniref:Pyrophosphatase PpaX n=1 Tax=Ureibacillus terrenus TaxID=118246 RepID=A0A540V1U6_9BACL|nr:pyrophosphatase PpaX [Ureibacillus terrenus]MED3661028.1 pyrophosphatase PpaX [Ureibacillus terrenus]MED3763314.1 pyrophosphatase PpaX [Ureibacillus terrenus]TQE90730.1 pyrophosphatase PpaX [Ureibacillus terrenus]